VAVLFLVRPLAAQTTTYTWDAGGANTSWGTASNWVGDVVPTFNTNAILVFNTNVGTADTLFLATQRQIRGIVFGANLTGGGDNVFDIQTRTTLNGSTVANLLFNGGATNASITLDNNTAGLTRVRLGQGNEGAISFQTATDLFFRLRNIRLYTGTADQLKREFENGLVLLNESQFKPWKVKLGSGEYRRLQGTIRPDINDGRAVSGTVTVPPSDAVYLLKPRAGAAPKASASAGQ